MAHLVLGLGNPGPQYAETRHNVGFRVVEELARRHGVPLDRLECNSRLAALQVAGTAAAGETGEAGGLLLLAQPQTYMNRSGHAARCLLELHTLEPSAVLVVYDEINLPLGRLRLRRAGSPAGHRGIESVLESLRTDQVPRLRLGVAPEGGAPAGEDWAKFVLGPFAAAERETVAAMIARAADACEAWWREGTEAAMNRFNR
jgi:PTH1 family peptidyl-tRNA hydrolase